MAIAAPLALPEGAERTVLAHIGKSSPSSCGQPMFPSFFAKDWTPCSSKNS